MFFSAPLRFTPLHFSRIHPAPSSPASPRPTRPQPTQLHSSHLHPTPLQSSSTHRSLPYWTVPYRTTLHSTPLHSTQTPPQRLAAPSPPRSTLPQPYPSPPNSHHTTLHSTPLRSGHPARSVPPCSPHTAPPHPAWPDQPSQAQNLAEITSEWHRNDEGSECLQNSSGASFVLLKVTCSPALGLAGPGAGLPGPHTL